MTTGTELAEVFDPTVGAVDPIKVPMLVSRRPPTSAAGRAAMIVSCFADVAAPVGSGREAAEIGCVACQNVPVTATEAAIDTGCVACQKVPETGCVAWKNVPV